MRLHYPRKHLGLYCLAILLSVIAVLVAIIPTAKAAEDFSFVGSVDAAVSVVDGKTQYGPVTVVLTDITTSKTQSSELPAKTPTVNISGTTQAVVNFDYKFNNLNKADTYQVCIPSTSLCTPKIGPNEQFSYLSVDKTAINSDINVSLQDFKDNPAAIPVTAKTVITSSPDTCGSSVPGLGWVICPLITGLTELNDSVWNLATSLLRVNPLNQSDAIFTAWGTIRNLANVIFALIFVIMIFSQVSNIGITNYGIKKLLPRLIIGAVLVNVSFIVVQVAVDLANIIGTGLYDLLLSISPNINVSIGWGHLVNLILGGGLIIGGTALTVGIGSAFWLLLPVVLMALLGLIAAILTLIFRQAVIPVLAILAPLAFVAYLLPNTESWFKKWRDLFMSMLMLYPLAALVFGGTNFAARIIIGDGNNAWNTMIGLIMLTLPLFSLPFLVRKSGAVISTVGSALNNLANKAKSPLTKATAPYAERARVQAENRAINSTTRFNPKRSYLRYKARTEAVGQNQQSEFNRAKTGYIAETAQAKNSRLRTRMASGGAAGAEYRVEANAVAALDKMQTEEVSTVATLMKDKYNQEEMVDRVVIELQEAINSGDKIKAKAAQSILFTQGSRGLDELHKTIATNLKSQKVMDNKNGERDAIYGLRKAIASQGLKSKDSSLNAWSYTDDSLANISVLDKTINSLSPEELAGQRPHVLREFINSGKSINKDLIRAAISNPNTAAKIDTETRKIFEDELAKQTSGNENTNGGGI